MSTESTDWAVYEHANGCVWHVEPPTQANASVEAALCSKDDAYTSHEAMPLERAQALANAFSHGRMAGRQATA